MIFLATVTHDLKSNTLEAVWLEEVFDETGKQTGFQRVKCRNYSAAEKAEFLTDCGADGQKYVSMAGW